MDYQGHGWFCSLDSFFLVVVKPEHEAPAQRATYIVGDYSQAMQTVLNSMYDFNKLVDEVDAAVENGILKLVDGETPLKRVPFGCV